MNLLDRGFHLPSWAVFLVLLSGSYAAKADVVTDWNIKARNIVVDSKLYTPPANRVLAIVHTAAYEAANSITLEYPPSDFNLDSSPGASVEAAIAAANHITLLKLLPGQQATIDLAYSSALKDIPDGLPKEAGIESGVKAAEAVLTARTDDGADTVESYRPHAGAGIYVPTVIPAVPQWPQRRPWLMSKASQFRPGPPPSLDSKEWARDFNEVKEIGAAKNATRTKQQTDIAKFWEATLPPIYHGVVHSVAEQEGRTLTQNARLFAVITQASDDALISVFDAKYHYRFWRPVTAIRNADNDGNQATERDATWSPFIPTPMHPEYPCAHCVVAATVGAILKAEVGDLPMPQLTTRSVTANNTKRSWSNIENFVQEVNDARIYDGVHYRTSTEVGSAMGKKIGEQAVRKHSNR